MDRYRTFAEARQFARSLSLESARAWRAFSKTTERPADIPANPARYYKNHGWIDWGDFLGSGQVSSKKRIYRSFHQARIFARSLNFSGAKAWRQWSNSGQRPDDIPTNPNIVYRNAGWQSWGDWLGTGVVTTHNREFRSFVNAREFTHGLNLMSQREWFEWAQSAARPHDIPSSPASTYKSNGWKGWGDWLGTGSVAPQQRNFLAFEQAREIVRALRLKNQNEWRIWIKANGSKLHVPSAPHQVYTDQGWLSWGDWLGTDFVANSKKKFSTFHKAREFVHKLALKNSAEWRKWSMSSARPSEIPTNPNTVYKNEGWSGWADWLGASYVASSGAVVSDKHIASQEKKKFRAFEEARALVRTLGHKNQKEWQVWARSGQRPDDIPSNPARAYRQIGWIDWGDWLGTGSKASQGRVYRPFTEAREYVRSLKLGGLDGWYQWSNGSAIPDDIPKKPYRVYKDSGWQGFGDWIGSIERWNKNAVLSFLRDIGPVLHTLRPIELFAIMRQNGMIESMQQKTSASDLIQRLQSLSGSQQREEVAAALVEDLTEPLVNESASEIIDDITVTTTINTDIKSEESLPQLMDLDSLDSVDNLVKSGIVADEETIEFLVSNRVSELWNSLLNQKQILDIDTIRKRKSGTYFETIKRRFFEQYDGACALSLPKGYSFTIDGNLVSPNLMQRLTAFRVMTERRIGNWSGVGAGKTISAILAGRVIGAHITVIIAFNSTIDGWERAIRQVFPRTLIHKKETGPIAIDLKKPNYILLNFEKFQQPTAEQFVRRIVQEHEIDFVVLDEIQNVKQRRENVESKRRKLVSAFLSAITEKNSDLCVLGMSATPVINNLFEGKALLEMVTGKAFPELETASTIANASALHEKLILHGIRYRPKYDQTIDTKLVEIDGQDLVPRLRMIGSRGILDTESILLEKKIAFIQKHLESRTLIYSHYKTQLLPKLIGAVREKGLSVGIFTGDDKTGLDAFLCGRADVLIGTAPVGTGVDGLQHVCNKLIIASLPWTAAEYEQLLGRLFRQGSKFKTVEVIIPQIVLSYGDTEWSWDKLRMRRIEFKRTLADAAVDGVIPEGVLESEKAMFSRAQEALKRWLVRVEEDGVSRFEREVLRIPLSESDIDLAIRRLGDFSVMNARINSAKSSTTHERFKNNPTEWYSYHTLYRQARANWTEIPYTRIAESLKMRPDWLIGDFGCGEALFSTYLSNKVYSFDHVAINKNVIPCDISNVPLDDGTLDVAVFSLSLMGTNYFDYLIEAKRTLKFGGLLKIAEPVGRWNNSVEELVNDIRRAGFQILGEPERSYDFFYINAVKL